MCYYQYRITFNDKVGPILNEFPNDQWPRIGNVWEQRGGYAKLERRLITDDSILPMLMDATGFIKLPDGKVICPWDILAEFDDNLRAQLK